MLAMQTVELLSQLFSIVDKAKVQLFCDTGRHDSIQVRRLKAC